MWGVIFAFVCQLLQNNLLSPELGVMLTLFNVNTWCFLVDPILDLTLAQLLEIFLGIERAIEKEKIDGDFR